MEKLVGILLMGGSSERFGGPENKLLAPLNGNPVFSCSLDVFASCAEFERVIVVVNKNIVEQVTNYSMTHKYKVEIIEGGQTRQESVQKALKYLIPDNNNIVVIHDAARPLVDKDVILKVANAATESNFGGATTFIPMTDTIATFEKDCISSFPDRARFVQIQTPQAFKLKFLLEAHNEAENLFATDDCSLVYQNGHGIILVKGSKKLHKITTQEDIIYLEGYLKRWKSIKLAKLSKGQ